MVFFKNFLWVFVSDAKLWGKNQKNIALFYNYVALICEIASMEVWLALRVGVQPRRQYRGCNRFAVNIAGNAIAL